MNGTLDPLVGQVLDSRYEVLAKVARGGMAAVYRARDLRLSRTVALKVMRSDLTEDDEFIAKFDREARSAAVLSHQNIVSIFDQGVAHGQPYIVMEYVDGETLRRVISREAPLPPEQALTYMEGIASALAAAHDAGVVHRDIKPENVLISHRGQLKVVDFGLARRVGSPQMTATGVLVGTASYLPPELVTHSRPDSRSDVYSAGILLFELLTGSKPHTGENNYQIAYRHVNVDIQPPSVRLAELHKRTNWQIPDYLDALVQAATARDPEQRIADGETLLNGVRRALSQLQSSGYADNPTLATQFAPAPSSSAITQPLPRLAKRPRPLPGPDRPGWLPAAAKADDSPQPNGSETPPTSSHVPLPGEASPARSPQSGRPSPALPIKKVGNQPRSQHTPVFHLSTHPTHRRRRGILALLLVILLTAGASVGSWWWMAGRYTTVPALVNQSEASIRQAATTAQVELEMLSEHSEDVPAGQVIRTDPTAGERVLRNSNVQVVVSLGPERFAMPTVEGLTLEAAKEALAERNLALGEVTEEWHEEIAAGTVLKAEHDPEVPLKRDTAVAVVVSKGREPISIKDYRGRDVAKAVKELEGAGFKVSVGEEHSTDVAKDKVLAQSPSEGTGHRGDEIQLVRSLGPVMVTVPEVEYLPRQEAEKALRDAGLKWRVEKASGFPLSLGIAAGTSPGAGTSVPEGTEVILYIA